MVLRGSLKKAASLMWVSLMVVLAAAVGEQAMVRVRMANRRRATFATVVTRKLMAR